jgi:hypothetical protein
VHNDFAKPYCRGKRRTLASNDIRRFTMTKPDDYRDGLAVHLSDLLDRFALLQEPGLVAALGIDQQDTKRDLLAARVAMICTRAPQLVSNLAADRLGVLQSIFPGTDLGAQGTRRNSEDSAEFRTFRSAVEALAAGMASDPEPATPLARVRRTRHVAALTELSPVPAGFVDALPPALAGLVRHLAGNMVRVPEADGSPATAATSMLRGEGAPRPGTPGSRHLPAGPPRPGGRGPS